MKNLIKLSVIVLAVVFMACSCDPDPILPDETLEELYPEWVNLSSVETTDEFTNIVDYPTLDITINGDEMTVVQTMWNNESETTYPLSSTYPAGDVTITNVDFILAESVMNGEFRGTYTKNGSDIILTTTGFSDTEYTYILQPQ